MTEISFFAYPTDFILEMQESFGDNKKMMDALCSNDLDLRKILLDIINQDIEDLIHCKKKLEIAQRTLREIRTAKNIYNKWKNVFMWPDLEVNINCRRVQGPCCVITKEDL